MEDKKSDVWKCSECQEPYLDTVDYILRSNRYVKEAWCYKCGKHTKVERIEGNGTY